MNKIIHFFLFFFFYISFASPTNIFPPIKYTKYGIFKWYKFLDKLKKPLNNKSFFGMTINISSPDLSMIIRDIVKNHMGLYDLNISSKIYEVVNRQINQSTTVSLLGSTECGSENKNVCNFKKFTKINLNLERLGVSEEHLNIFVGNIAGCMSPTSYLMAFTVLTLIYYIIQIILSFFYFKPENTNRPYISSIILYYIGIVLLLISIAFYFCSYKDINSFYYTFYNFNDTYPVIMNSLSESLHSITSIGIPNAVGPLVNVIENIANETQYYIQTLSKSFLNPTIQILEDLVLANKSYLGVFPIYDDKIRPIADEFYDKAKKYPNLNDLPVYFGMSNFSSFQNTMFQLLETEMRFSDRIQRISLFFQYFNSTIGPYQQYIINLTNQRINGRYKTIGEYIKEIETGKLSEVRLLYDLEKMAKKDYKFYIIIRIIFFIFGCIYVFFIIFYAVIYMMHNKISLCMANTISIFPIISTILICIFNFIFTSIGYTDYELSDQLEYSLDNMISSMIDIIIPDRQIVFYPINMSYYTDGEFQGILNLSSIVFPEKMTNILHFTESNENTGVIKAFDIGSILNITKYGDEIGDFIINLGQNFTLSEKTLQMLDDVQQLLKLALLFPKNIDGLFNWGAPMTDSTRSLRNEIKKKDPIALIELNPFLNEIDNYSHLMNMKYDAAISLISGDLSNSLKFFNVRLQNYTKEVMDEMGTEIKRLSRQVYPVLNEIKAESFIGPYALLRNAFFYDISKCTAYISISGMLMMIGFPFIVTLMWIRRKGMKIKEGQKDSEIDLQSLDNININNNQNQQSSTHSSQNMANGHSNEIESRNDNLNEIENNNDNHDEARINNDESHDNYINNNNRNNYNENDNNDINNNNNSGSNKKETKNDKSSEQNSLRSNDDENNGNHNNNENNNNTGIIFTSLIE